MSAAVAGIVPHPVPKRIVDGGYRPEWFGAKGDWVDTTDTLGTGTDDTAAFQACVDALLAADASVMELRSKYRIDGTVYINPGAFDYTASPFTIRGLTGNPWAAHGRGAAIIRRVTGDILRVNLDAAGNHLLDPTLLYSAFAVENVSIIGKSLSEGVTVAGITAFRTFRTRITMRNVYAVRLDYLMYQPDTDADGHENGTNWVNIGSN